MCRLERQISLIGAEACERLSEACVFIAGVGGVGGYAAEAMARMGVGRLVIVDNDTVSESNINRQIIATYSSVGKSKTDVMAERIHSIAPECEVVALPTFITRDNAAELIRESEADAVIDAVDNVTAKVAMICAARDQEKYIISCMGTGNKLDSSRFRVADIYETSGCALARVMRHELRKRGVDKLDVIFSDEPDARVGSVSGVRVPSSIVYMPAIAGLMAAERVFKTLSGVL